MKTLASTLAATLLLVGSAAAQADKCVGLEKFAAEKPGLSAKPAFLQLKAAGEAPPPAGVDCSSLTSVFKRVVDGTRPGGRKLEDDKPFDRAEAQANLDKALQDPEIRAQLDKLQHDVPDETTRLLYEAAVLDSEGFYNARELRIQQLREKLGG